MMSSLVSEVMAGARRTRDLALGVAILAVGLFQCSKPASSPAAAHRSSQVSLSHDAEEAEEAPVASGPKATQAQSPVGQAREPKKTAYHGPRLEDLPVEGFLDAVVSIPGSSIIEPPLVVAAHGAGGAPEHHCIYYTELLAGQAFILCPRGRAISARDNSAFYYPDHIELEKEVLAALAAFEEAFGARAADGPIVYAAYSQGATMGAFMLPAHGQLFQRLLLIEGGYSSWSLASAKRFSRAGGLRVLFVCGISSCASKARRSARWLNQAGSAAKVEHAHAGGHTYLGRVAERVAEQLPWLLEGDDRWRRQPNERRTGGEPSAR